MEVLAPVGCEFESRMGTSMLCSAVRCSPFAYSFCLKNVVVVASAFRMLLGETLAVIFDVTATSLKCSRR